MADHMRLAITTPHKRAHVYVQLYMHVRVHGVVPLFLHTLMHTHIDTITHTRSFAHDGARENILL